MATQVTRRRGTTAQHATFIGALAELTVDTDKKTVVVHDGVTEGGSPLVTEDALGEYLSSADVGVIVQAYNATLAGIAAGTTELSNRNKIIGHFGQNQRGLTSVADDAYCCDRWYVLTESGNVTVGQVTDPESGAPWAWKLTQPDASPKRMGLATIIEAKDIKAFRSAAMNLFMRVKPSFSGNVRYAIIEHTGSADVVTSDVVNNWSSATFTPSNFFVAGLNIIKTGTIAPGAATYGDLNDYGVMGASLTNAVLFVWTESAQAQNATLELNRPQFEPGTIHTPHEWRANELQLCQRYYEVGSVYFESGLSGGSARGCSFGFKVTKRAAPTITPSTSNGSPTIDSITTEKFRAYNGSGNAFSFDWAAEKEL